MDARELDERIRLLELRLGTVEREPWPEPSAIAPLPWLDDRAGAAVETGSTKDAATTRWAGRFTRRLRGA